MAHRLRNTDLGGYNNVSTIAKIGSEGFIVSKFSVFYGFPVSIKMLITDFEEKLEF